MSHTLRVDIVSAEAEIFSGAAQLVVATGEMGELGIAPRPAPLLTARPCPLLKGDKLGAVLPQHDDYADSAAARPVRRSRW